MQTPKPTAAELPPEGFTLVEILIATTLVGIVMAMAMTGFTQAKKAADLSRSISVGNQEAASGLKEVVSILRRASIIYYTGRPMTAMADGDLLPAGGRTAIPAPLLNLPGGTAGPSIHFDAGNPTGITANQTAPFSAIAGSVTRNSFRFSEAAGGSFRASGTGVGAQSRLRGGYPPPAGVYTANDFFSAPLVYCAEAVMGQNITGLGKDTTALVPQGWIFYVIYLAPMDMAPTGVAQTTMDSDPLFPIPGTGPRAVQDRGGNPGAAAPASWPRSIVPFELRLLTIRGNGPKGEIPAVTAGGRQLDQNGAIYPVPWDIKANQAIYDPVSTPNGINAGGIRTGAYMPYNAAPPLGNNVATHDDSRVLGVPSHSNWGSPANDPPTTNVYGSAAAASSSDRVLCRYIDPDNPAGTFIKFENPYYNNGQPGVPAALAGNNRLVDTYEGGFQDYDAGTNQPSRAIVSITTRFRTSRQVPFQFSTKSEEISLEAFRSYCDSSKLRWNRN